MKRIQISKVGVLINPKNRDKRFLKLSVEQKLIELFHLNDLTQILNPHSYKKPSGYGLVIKKENGSL